ncbi:MAG TPA: hypothetical protein PLN35_20990 [Quisquiliibacterium sp.]|nr:hypothetical protein [Quisquiliibacterium sp.]
MAGDNLLEIIAAARAEMPEIPASAWERFEAVVRRQFGAQRVYVAARRKREQLRVIEQSVAQEQAADKRRLAAELGVSVRRINQLLVLCRE